jgi:Protein of unknown function (DUF4242)
VGVGTVVSLTRLVAPYRCESHPAGSKREERRSGAMPLFMDHHKGVEGLTAEAVADAHRKDMEIQDQYGVKYHRYWFNEDTGEVFCLAEAPNKEAAEAVHREAHGLVADEIVEVQEGS